MSFEPRDIKKYKLSWVFNTSRPIFVGDYRNVQITVCQGGIGGTASLSIRGTKDTRSPNFTAASTINNSWSTMLLSDEQTPGNYVTTFTIASGETRSFEINTNLLTYIAARRTFEGTAPEIYVTLTNNQ